MASARLMPIALTLMRTSFGPGAGTWTSTNSRTSGPPAFTNLIERDMAVPLGRTVVEGFRNPPFKYETLLNKKERGLTAAIRLQKRPQPRQGEDVPPERGKKGHGSASRRTAAQAG